MTAAVIAATVPIRAPRESVDLEFFQETLFWRALPKDAFQDL